MQTVKYARKPFYVDAVQVTSENMEEVAKWCQGTIATDSEGEAFIKVRVHRPLNEDQTQAYVGKWVLYAGTGYKVYTEKAFEKSFEKVRHLTKAQADEAGIFPPHEPKQPMAKIASDLKVTAKPGPPPRTIYKQQPLEKPFQVPPTQEQHDRNTGGADDPDIQALLDMAEEDNVGHEDRR